MQTIQCGQSLLLVQAQQEAFWTQIFLLLQSQNTNQTPTSAYFPAAKPPREKQSPQKINAKPAYFKIYFHTQKCGTILSIIKNYMEFSCISPVLRHDSNLKTESANIVNFGTFLPPPGCPVPKWSAPLHEGTRKSGSRKTTYERGKFDGKMSRIYNNTSLQNKSVHNEKFDGVWSPSVYDRYGRKCRFSDEVKLGLQLTSELLS